jgi:cell division protein FtsZ
MKNLLERALERAGPPIPDHLQQHIELSPDDKELADIVEGLKLSIKVIGCGGGGSNTVSRLMEEGVKGTELIAINTDARHLITVHSHRKILIGKKKTRGLGAGGDPTIGEESAREEEEALKKILANSHIVFVTTGLGGGTGTGAAPFVANMAKHTGALTIVFATKPFKGEGSNRANLAQAGLERLATVSDTVVAISNDKLLEISPKLPLNKAFMVLDELLMNAIKAMIELVTKPGLVNLDYNDLRTIMEGGGVSMIGIGSSSDEPGERAELAVKEVLSCPLLEYDISTASGALIKVSGGQDMTLQQAERVAELIQGKINPNARIIWGAGVEDGLEGTIRVMLVVTGVKSKDIVGRASLPEGSGSGLNVDQVR